MVQPHRDEQHGSSATHNAGISSQQIGATGDHLSARPPPGAAPTEIDHSGIKILSTPVASEFLEGNLQTEERKNGKATKVESLFVNSDAMKSEEQSIDEKANGTNTPSFNSGTFVNFSLLRRVKRSITRTSKDTYTKIQARLGRGDKPPSKDGRHIDLDSSRSTLLVDERSSKPYINNAIRSSRYTLLTFLPAQIWFQFSKVANLYFLVTGIIQLIPGLSTTGTYTTILPLVFFLCFTMAREGWDDWRRYREDKVENKKLTRVLRGGHVKAREGGRWEAIVKTYGMKLKQKVVKMASKTTLHKMWTSPKVEDEDCDPTSPWVKVKWIHVKVGDIIELRRDEQVPADIALLHADGRDGVAYVETMALDGETNLKSRYPVPQLKCHTLDDISTCRAHFVSEDPNLDLYDFHGKVSINGSTLPLTLSNVIFRGSTIRNTTRVVGMVINTGEECKIRMNASKNPTAKSPAIQSQTNKIVVLLAFFVIILSSGCTLGYVLYKRDFEHSAWYLANGSVRMIDIFIAFAIMFNNLIPLALYVSLELIKFAQFLLLADVEMYDERSNTPMVCNTQNIFENLGQITHILSDKTGTLTENVMRLRMISVGGQIWKHDFKSGKDVSDVGTAKKSSEIHVTTTAEDLFPITRKSTTPATPRITLEVPTAPQMLSIPNNASMCRTTHNGDIIKYLQSSPATALAEKLRFFILSLAICHTCFPEAQNSGKTGFQAASPDELALVEAAQDLGYLLIDRTTQTITILTSSTGLGSGAREIYEVLNIVEFSSKRKRMSIVVKFPDGKICLFCKGADSVLLPRFRKNLEAEEAASIVEDRRLQRKSMEVEDALVRKSIDVEARKSLQRNRSSLNISRPGPPTRNNSGGYFSRRSTNSYEQEKVAASPTSPGIPRMSMGNFSNRLEVPSQRPSFQNDRRQDCHEESNILEDCLEHINQFAADGLRTLVFGYRFLSPEEYHNWSTLHHTATTSLTNRQEMIESAAEHIEQNLDLAGATGIEDKLQDGVPETIEKLQRANIKIWILTGDKLETAINIAHSAGICKTFSEIIILTSTEEVELANQMSEHLLKLKNNSIAHSVLVIDGQTLIEIEANQNLIQTFHELLLEVNSVICTRAYPYQKASLVLTIRHLLPSAITLAIGDGGNDIAMILEAHVGIGISGKEGLQAARVADYSIAQFRFLQRLLLVHGHWLYVRTTKFILLTFWKEMLFYIVQALYQRWNGYTGTSLFESWSLAVWNTLFTALPVMIPGIFEQDLSADTLLERPQLYAYGQMSKGFNWGKYWWWMFMASCEAILIYFMVYGLYRVAYQSDQGLFATGDLVFSVCVVFINVKLLVLDYHYLTWIPVFCCVLTLSGWWAWNLFLSAAYTNAVSVYTVRGAFVNHFDLTWWSVLIIVCMACVAVEVVVDVVERRWWGDEVMRWQEIEQERRKGRLGIGDENVDEI